MSTLLTNAIIEVQENGRRYFKSMCLEQREQIQQDILCILDGLDDEIIDNVCDIIVDRFQIILNELENQNA